MSNHRFTLDYAARRALTEQLTLPIALDVLGNDEIVELFATAIASEAWHNCWPIADYLDGAFKGIWGLGIGEHLTPAERSWVRELLGVKLAA